MDDQRATPTAASPPPAEKPRAVRAFRTKRFILWLLVSLGTAAILLPVALTATPRQCTTCHEMQPYYDSWQASSHRTAVPNCLYCHVRPHVFNLVAWEAGFYGQIIGHFTGRQPATTAKNTPSVDSCLLSGCHSLNRESSASGDLKINHRLHVAEARISCPVCHAGAVHDGVAGRPKIPPMKLCKQCHAQKMTQCSYCHTQLHAGPVPDGH